MKAIKFSISKDERDKIRQRTKAALQSKKLLNPNWKAGTPENLTPQARKQGTINNQMRALLNENNRRASALIMQLKPNMSLQKIAAYLNEHGYRTANNKLFKKTTVSRLYKRAITPQNPF